MLAEELAMVRRNDNERILAIQPAEALEHVLQLLVDMRDRSIVGIEFRL